MQELYHGADRMQKVSEMKHVEVMAAMSVFANKYSTPSSWEPFAMTERAKRVLTEVNAQRAITGKHKQFAWNHMEGIVFQAGFTEVTEQTAVMNEEDHGRFVALMRSDFERSTAPEAQALVRKRE